MKLLAFAAQYTIDDLRRATNESIDYLLKLIEDLTDEDVVFEPIDPDANDPYAAEGEQHIGWNIAHLIAHVTASSEEGAAFSSLLARGIAAQERPRYETPWRDITTKAQCVQRLEESRRIRLAYLDTWPDAPFLDVYRQVSERFIEKFGQMNAPAAFLFGLWHEVGHYDQIKEVIRQAKQAKAQNA
ncbi:MAG: DinB family protein [Chloroflexi bacterium]|nr:MAG: DinB family protein [Chloroflexota bacterium]